jgi:acetyl esterase
MPLLPALKPMFDAQHQAPGIPPAMPPGQLREMMHAMIDREFASGAGVQPPARIERDFTIPVDGGEITLRLFRDDDGDAVLPCHVYYHGGGFFLGTLDQTNGLGRELTRAAGCAVLSVDYRLAPEYKFPAAAEDSYAALVWAAAHAEELKIDPARISVGGGSAGGNLAAVVCQMARDRSGPALVAQVLEIPVTDFTSTATLDFPDENIHINAGKGYAAMYLRDDADASNPLASPLLSETLDGLPPALVLCAEYDQLQPEGKAYAERLKNSGVPTIYRLLEGQFHGSQGMDSLIPEEASANRKEISDFLRRIYGRT